jgi:hypothetical protein
MQEGPHASVALLASAALNASTAAALPQHRRLLQGNHDGSLRIPSLSDWIAGIRHGNANLSLIKSSELVSGPA